MYVREEEAELKAIELQETLGGSVWEGKRTPAEEEEKEQLEAKKKGRRKGEVK